MLEWGRTQAHGYIMEMGGFMLFEGNIAKDVLSERRFSELLMAGKIELPFVTVEEIEDRSKADGFWKWSPRPKLWHKPLDARSCFDGSRIGTTGVIIKSLQEQNPLPWSMHDPPPLLHYLDTLSRPHERFSKSLFRIFLEGFPYFLPRQRSSSGCPPL